MEKDGSKSREDLDPILCVRVTGGEKTLQIGGIQILIGNKLKIIYN